MLLGHYHLSNCTYHMLIRKLACMLHGPLISGHPSPKSIGKKSPAQNHKILITTQTGPTATGDTSKTTTSFLYPVFYSVATLNLRISNPESSINIRLAPGSGVGVSPEFFKLDDTIKKAKFKNSSSSAILEFVLKSMKLWQG